jgi:hypothetical protein
MLYLRAQRNLMSTSDFLTSLYSRFGESRVLVRDEDILPYGFDGTAALKQRPDCVFFPQGTEEVADVLKIAKEHRKPVVTGGWCGRSLPREDGSHP